MAYFSLVKYYSKFLLLTLAVFSLSSFRQQKTVDEWVYEREKKGIKVFTKKGKWGKFRDSKATMVVKSSPEEMLRLITDFDNYHTWLPRCKKARIIARISENEFIAHIIFDAPWPVADRDCVVRVKVERNTNGTVIIRETSEPKYMDSEDGVVRIQQMTATWKFTPTQEGTEVINEYSSNPGGSLPDWMTNTQSVETPMATFENLQNKTSSKKQTGKIDTP